MSRLLQTAAAALPALSLAALIGVAFLLNPADAEARLCRGEAEAACKERPECQWLERERRDPEAQARAEASPAFHCVPRPATGDSITDRQERARRRVRDRETSASAPETVETDDEAKRPVEERFETDVPKQGPGRERVERAADVERPPQDRGARRGELTDAEKEAKRAAARARREERMKQREKARAQERERSSQAREEIRKKREAAKSEAMRKRRTEPKERAGDGGGR